MLHICAINWGSAGMRRRGSEKERGDTSRGQGLLKIVLLCDVSVVVRVADCWEA